MKTAMFLNSNNTQQTLESVFSLPCVKTWAESITCSYSASERLSISMHNNRQYENSGGFYGCFSYA